MRGWTPPPLMKMTYMPSSSLWPTACSHGMSCGGESCGCFSKSLSSIRRVNLRKRNLRLGQYGRLDWRAPAMDLSDQCSIPQPGYRRVTDHQWRKAGTSRTKISNDTLTPDSTSPVTGCPESEPYADAGLNQTSGALHRSVPHSHKRKSH
jgi:hypothetical protein